MSQSAGPGSPVFFNCAKSRYYSRSIHSVTLTGRTKPYKPSAGHAMGQRSTHTSREYKCECGHVGWSNHIDLQRMADEAMKGPKPFFEILDEIDGILEEANSVEA